MARSTADAPNVRLDGSTVETFFLFDLVIGALVAAALPLGYALWRHASLRGLVFVSVVAFALFVAWFIFELNSFMQLLGGAELASLWPVFYGLAGAAAAESVAAWIGWRWHLKRYPSGPRGEQARPADGVGSEQQGNGAVHR
jgi:hypothetical protein